MGNKVLRQLIVIGIVMVFLVACGKSSAGTPAAVTPTSGQGTGQTEYSDPFAYCAAVGTVDAPDARYSGDPMPESIIQGMIQQGIVSGDAPLDFVKNAVWRCMDGNVWVCHFGANLPCTEKADTSQVPTSAMEDFCKANSTADSIPAAVTGRATVYEWACNDGKPEVVKQVFHSDAQGFLAEFWYELPAK
jgi:hypothetical protein